MITGSDRLVGIGSFIRKLRVLYPTVSLGAVRQFLCYSGPKLNCDLKQSLT
jgi:hypothetical protein